MAHLDRILDINNFRLHATKAIVGGVTSYMNMTLEKYVMEWLFKRAKQMAVNWYFVAAARGGLSSTFHFLIDMEDIPLSGDVEDLAEDIAYKCDLDDISPDEMEDWIRGRFSKISERSINTNTLTRRILNKKQVEKMRSMYRGFNPELSITVLDYVYGCLGAVNMSISVPPPLIECLRKGSREVMELFGSPFNVTCERYCSPFLLEKDFGSEGSFFNYTLEPETIYIFNPPFDTTFMNEASKRLISELERLKGEDVTVIAVIPVWDADTQEENGMKSYGMDFSFANTLLSCSYLHEKKVLDRKDHKFYNFFTNDYDREIQGPFHLLLFHTGCTIPTIESIVSKW